RRRHFPFRRAPVPRGAPCREDLPAAARGSPACVEHPHGVLSGGASAGASVCAPDDEVPAALPPAAAACGLARSGGSGAPSLYWHYPIHTHLWCAPSCILSSTVEIVPARRLYCITPAVCS